VAETKPINNFDRILLKQRGLDPESVQSRGQADLAVRCVNIRRAHKLAEIPTVLRLIAIGVDAKRAYTMTAVSAQVILRARDLRMHP
jgi:hypothetical protein